MRHSFPPRSLLWILSLLFVMAAGHASAEKPADTKAKESAEKSKAPADKKPRKEVSSPKGKSAEPSGKSAEPSGKSAEEKKEKSKTSEPASEKEKQPAGKTHKVTSGEFVVTRKISGVVESSKQTPVAVDLKRWADLSILEVVPHGTEVKQGDVLIDLDSEKLEKAIGELRDSMPLKEMELTTAVEALEKLEKTTPLSLASSRRTKQEAEEDLAYFEDVNRPMREKGAKNDVKSAENYLAYATEELNQLKKMYERDDLTEETEEIILQRARNSVDDSAWALEQTRERTRRLLSTTIPREAERLASAMELQRINWRAEEKSLRDQVKKAKLELEGKKRAHEEAVRSLAEHESDLENLDVRAPHDGIVYYGMSQKGKWTTAAAVERKLIPGGKLTMLEIVMTVVDPSAPRLRAMVPEDRIHGLAKGQKAVVSVKILPDVEVKGQVESVARVPYSDGTFDAVVDLSPGKHADAIVPGIGGEAEIVVHEKKSAITIPKNAVRKEGDRHVVTLDGGGKRPVEIGRASGDRIEILKGLAVGDEIVLGIAPAKPAEEKEKEDSDKEGEKK